MVRANRRITLEEIEDGLNEDCSYFSVHKIVSETLGYRKVSARWVDKWLKEAAGEWYNTGITKLVDRMKKVIEHQGDYDCTTLEQRAVIRFLNAEGIQTSQICQRMKNIYGRIHHVKLSTIIKLGFEVLEHPAYIPDLAPSDYFLFGLLKKELKGKRFDSDENVQKVVQDFFHTLLKNAYKEGIYKFPERWRRCIESQGDYFE
ncbi:hypothetical protein LAZ67_4000649 [Cordylochernes scorpioides]|uniref:Transposase n=1 Tax=Cordylochernes scorpioides TaxID=51811 RepID=A0ABY6KCH7_9ARAC|nr:hypothetical protein LAZ67_4000649 [Cordylochernes scorpioides]